MQPEREFWPEPELEPDCYNLAGTRVSEPGPDQHPQSWLDLAGFLTEFGISSSVVYSNTIYFNFIMKIFVIVIELYENLKKS